MTRAHLRRNDAEQHWKQCSDMTGASYRNLLKWKDLPIAEAYVEEKVKEAVAGTHLQQAHQRWPSCCRSAAVDRTGSGDDSYAAESACEAVIRSIERGVLEREMREHINKLREQMALLEQGRPIDV